MEDEYSERPSLFSRRVLAGKRTYFFDVVPTKTSEDLYVVITERRRAKSLKPERHRLFLYKEDFGKFHSALAETMRYIETNMEKRPEQTLKT
jgi:hypothetical protein